MKPVTYVIIALTLLLAGVIFYYESCNKPRIDYSQIDSLITTKLHRSDSLTKQGLDSLIKISTRDSLHNITINNIFNNAKQQKEQVYKEAFNREFVIGIKRLLDSVSSANH